MVSALKTAFKGRKTNSEGIKAPLVQTTAKLFDLKKVCGSWENERHEMPRKVSDKEVSAEDIYK